MKKKIWFRSLFPGLVIILLSLSGPAQAEEGCISCHEKLNPGLVLDWRLSRHSEKEISCSVCHGDKHDTAENAGLAELPDETVCGECHVDQYNQFSQGKHNFGWTAMNALPAAHLAPDELVEGGRGCGGCHNMGIKSEALKKEQRDKGYRYQTNSCDECHTRHTFSKKEAANPRACQQCHMGYDHPQWEMWSSSKHGARYLAREAGHLPPEAPAPACQDCHMPDGDHNNHTAWGFFGVRLPLPEDKEWAADRVTILKYLSVLDPETGEPGPFLDAVKAFDLARIDQQSWQRERDRMLAVCSRCHSASYAEKQLAMGDSILKKADRLMAEAIETVAGLYHDGIIAKPDDYPFNYPYLLVFMETGGEEGRSNPERLSFIDQVLAEMYMKHRMRTFQAFFHVNPDYAYWYGWAEMTKDLGRIKELARGMRACSRENVAAPDGPENQAR